MKKLFWLGLLAGCYAATAQTPVLPGEELFGSLRARQIGPALMSGRITDLEGHPANDRILYVGTAGGGVWRSVDGGSTFTSIFDDYAQSVGVIAVDPTDPDHVIWVGTGETWTRNSTSVGDGLYKTTDGGANWQHMGFGWSERIAAIQINPQNGNEVYVAVLGPLWGDSDQRGVYKTTDGGQTWERVLAGTANTGCSELIMDKNNPNVLYAAFWEFRRTAWSFTSGGHGSALYKTTDGGATWKKIHHGLPEPDKEYGLGRFALALAPSNSQILYAAVEAKEGMGLYRSDDAGETWEYLNKDFNLAVRPFYFSRIVVDPRNPDVLIKAGLFPTISRDGGKTFKGLGQMHADAHDVWFDIHDSDRFYVGTDGGVYRTWDGGHNMEMVNNLPVSQFYHVSVDNAEPYNVYGGLQDNGSWFGPSASPGGIEARDWTSVGYGDGFRVYKHPTRPYVYSEMQGAEGVWRYDLEHDRIRNIKPFPVPGYEELRFNWNAALVPSPNKPDRLYLGSQYLHRSDDSGDNWFIISPDLTTNDPEKQKQDKSGGISIDNSGAENHCTIFTIAESPLNEQVIWVGTDDGLVQITRDGGKNWTNVTARIPDLPANTWCYHIEASHHREGTAYAVFDGHTRNDPNTYVYKTTDYGQTWQSIVTSDIKGFARSLQEDYENENLLFLGTEFGLYITIDGGQHWARFTNNMPAAAVHYIELHPRTSDLVLATHGRGIIIIDDISPLRELTPEVLQKEVHFFRSRPVIMRDNSNFGGGSNGNQFVGPNPERNARIVYYLKKRHIFGKMAIEIRDAQGNKVSELDAKKKKGINIVTWNYRMKPPRVAKGKTFDFGGFVGPRVPAGTYTVVMTKGKKEYRHQLELLYDMDSGIPLADRKAQEKLAMELYNMSQELAYLVFQIDDMLAYADRAAAASKKLRKSAAALQEQLNELKKGLVILTGDNYVGAAKKQLREQISALYSVVVSNYERPANTQYKNHLMLSRRLEEAQTQFSYIRSKELARLEKAASRFDLESWQTIPFEQFLEEYK